MKTNIPFLQYVTSKLQINTADLAKFLFIDKRTVYNYKNYPIEKLPNKVKEKLIIFFYGYKDFNIQNLDLYIIKDILETLDDNTLVNIRNEFLNIAKIRETNRVITTTSELLKKNDIKREVNSLDEFLTDFKILVEYSNLSKGYLYTIFEIIISKIGNENDYRFLDYINNYKKGN